MQPATPTTERDLSRASSLEFLREATHEELLQVILDIAQIAVDDESDVSATVGTVSTTQPRLIIGWEWPSDLEILEASFSFDSEDEEDTEYDSDEARA